MDDSVTAPSTTLPRPDFQTLFESAPGSYLVLTPALVILAVNNTYLRPRMTRRQEILRRHLFDVFPDNPGDATATGVSNLWALQDFQHRVPDAMTVQKYCILRPESKGGGFEERHGSPVNSWVLGAKEELAYIIQRAGDDTEFIPLKQAGSDQDRITETLSMRAGEIEAEIFLRAQTRRSTANCELELDARKRTEESLQESKERFRSVTGTAPDAIMRSLPPRDRTYRRPIYDRTQRLERAEVP